MKFILLLIFLISSVFLKGQDTLLLLEGKQYFGQEIDTVSYPYSMKVYKKNGDFKLKKIYPEQIFSIKFNGQTEKIYYFKDS